MGAERQIERTLHEVLARAARAGKHVGLVAGVRANGSESYAGYGRAVAGGARIPDAHSIFEIGSITKVFTALALADMAEEGLVSLDDPVESLLPGVAVPTRGGRVVTLGDLASHTSGLPRLPPGLVRKARSDPANPYASFSDADLESSLGRTRLRRKPGTRFRYSNFGAGVLGHALALRCGCSYEQLIRERVCEPLGLDDTWVTPPGDLAGRVVEGHSRRGKPVPGWDLGAVAGAGALRSSAGDLMRLVDAQLDPPERRIGGAIALAQAPLRHVGRRMQIGLGWLSQPARGGRPALWWHNGGTGGFRSYAAFVPAASVGVVVLGNSARSVDGIGGALLDRLL